MAGMGEKRGAYRVLVGRPDEKNNLEELSVDGKIIFEVDGMGRHGLDRAG